MRIINSAGTAVYGGGSAADSTTDSEYSWPGAGTDKKLTLTVTDMVAGTTGFQFIATTAATTGGNRTAYVTCDVVAGGSYTCTIGSWNSTNSNYNLTVVSSSSVEEVTLKFTTSYLLDSDYFSYRISYTDDGGSSYLNVTPTTDGTLASGVYTYTATITSATIGVLLQWSVYIVEVIPVANTTDPAWVGTASGLSFTPTADLTSMTADLSANTVIYGAYNLGLATDWAKTFLLAFMNDGSATFSSGICLSDGTTADTDIATPWGTLSTSYSALGDDVKAAFTGATATANSASYVESAKSLYLAMIANHDLTDFAGLASSGSAVKAHDAIDTEDYIAIAMLGIVVAMGMVLLIRRKKQIA